MNYIPPKRSYLDKVSELEIVEKYLEWSRPDYALVLVLAFISSLWVIDFHDSDSWYFYPGAALFISNFFFGVYKFIKYRRYKKRAEILKVIES